ncbi:TIGR04211 family SH3 domain-containing protein [Gilvimarinus algae]|uniref:TIGR04211 family SH3 domain-containing protein n=1 Tax=Gilvimarinus algae TaxID=3058037 RepID=A0ABT8TJA7_9GAMM|nr:TIGR04211 family SH3 domain-containing protein [Gilvimarinus sp. SDUM040014]MDO3384169.1 TIGR04211 family SH3 domain-containing protein [Gilvimarinus sp. SDUM040014]
MRHLTRSAKVIRCALIAVSLLASQWVFAEARYIADELRVPLRSGMGNQYRIVHRGLLSGTELELIRTDTDDSDTPWSLVRTDDGLEGWIRSQYLLDEPTAAIKLRRLQEKMSQLDGDQSELLETNERLDQENRAMSEELAEIREQLSQTQEAYANLRKLSANAVALNEQYKKLNENYQLLQTRAEVLKTENARLTNNSRYREWIFGAGILIAGVIVSLLLQSLGRRKRRSEWG